MDELFQEIQQARSSDREAEQQASTEQKQLFGVIAKGAKQDIKERRRYAIRVYRFYKYWMWGLVFIVLIGGVEWSKKNGLSFDISEKVLLMLTGTTTLGVLGSFFSIIRYLFSTKNK